MLPRVGTPLPRQSYTPLPLTQARITEVFNLFHAFRCFFNIFIFLTFLTLLVLRYIPTSAPTCQRHPPTHFCAGDDTSPPLELGVFEFSILPTSSYLSSVYSVVKFWDPLLVGHLSETVPPFCRHHHFLVLPLLVRILNIFNISLQIRCYTCTSMVPSHFWLIHYLGLEGSALKGRYCHGSDTNPTSAPPHFRTSALPHLRTSAPPHFCTSALPHLRTSAPPHFRTSAFPHFHTSTSTY